MITKLQKETRLNNLDIISILIQELSNYQTSKYFEVDEDFEVDWNAINTSLDWSKLYLLLENDTIKKIEDFQEGDEVLLVFRDNFKVKFYSTLMLILNLSIIYKRYNIVSSYSELNISESFRDLDQNELELLKNKIREDLLDSGVEQIQGVEKNVFRNIPLYIS